MNDFKTIATTTFGGRFGVSLVVTRFGVEEIIVEDTDRMDPFLDDGSPAIIRQEPSFDRAMRGLNISPVDRARVAADLGISEPCLVCGNYAPDHDPGCAVEAARAEIGRRERRTR